MAYSKDNKDKINYYKSHPEIVYQEYIVNKKSVLKLADEWGLPKSTVYQLTKEAKLVGIKLADKITYCNEVKFDIADPIFCYMAGLASADSYIDESNHRVVFRMSEQAKEVLEYLKEYFEVSNAIKAYNTTGYSGKTTMYDLTISSQKLIDTLASLNITGRKKDLGVRFPDMAQLSDECQEMYIRGLWDGDGAVYNNKLYTSILEESQLMIDAIKEFLENKLKLNVRYESSRKFPSIYISGSAVLTFYNWMYRHNMDCKMGYKYNRYLEY